METICIDAFEDSFDIIQLNNIFNLLDNIKKSRRPLIILCIGTDRSTGDSLGPLVGHILSSYDIEGLNVYGTLSSPVHAGNLETTINDIYTKFTTPYIIAIDACLGKLQDIGKIYIEEASINPGAALQKSLPSIGDLSITGIVNISGKLEYMILQNTRLYTVLSLATCISKIFYDFYNNYSEKLG